MPARRIDFEKGDELLFALLNNEQFIRTKAHLHLASAHDTIEQAMITIGNDSQQHQLPQFEMLCRQLLMRQAFEHSARLHAMKAAEEDEETRLRKLAAEMDRRGSTADPTMIRRRRKKKAPKKVDFSAPSGNFFHMNTADNSSSDNSRRASQDAAASKSTEEDDDDDLYEYFYVDEDGNEIDSEQVSEGGGDKASQHSDDNPFGGYDAHSTLEYYRSASSASNSSAAAAYIFVPDFDAIYAARDAAVQSGFRRALVLHPAFRKLCLTIEKLGNDVEGATKPIWGQLLGPLFTRRTAAAAVKAMMNTPLEDGEVATTAGGIHASAPHVFKRFNTDDMLFAASGAPSDDGHHSNDVDGRSSATHSESRGGGVEDEDDEDTILVGGKAVHRRNSPSTPHRAPAAPASSLPSITVRERLLSCAGEVFQDPRNRALHWFIEFITAWLMPNSCITPDEGDACAVNDQNGPAARFARHLTSLSAAKQADLITIPLLQSVSALVDLVAVGELTPTQLEWSPMILSKKQEVVAMSDFINARNVCSGLLKSNTHLQKRFLMQQNLLLSNRAVKQFTNNLLPEMVAVEILEVLDNAMFSDRGYMAIKVDDLLNAAEHPAAFANSLQYSNNNAAATGTGNADKDEQTKRSKNDERDQQPPLPRQNTLPPTAINPQDALDTVEVCSSGSSSSSAPSPTPSDDQEEGKKTKESQKKKPTKPKKSSAKSSLRSFENSTTASFRAKRTTSNASENTTSSSDSIIVQRMPSDVATAVSLGREQKKRRESLFGASSVKGAVDGNNSGSFLARRRSSMRFSGSFRRRKSLTKPKKVHFDLEAVLAVCGVTSQFKEFHVKMATSELDAISVMRADVVVNMLHTVFKMKKPPTAARKTEMPFKDAGVLYQMQPLNPFYVEPEGSIVLTERTKRHEERAQKRDELRGFKPVVSTTSSGPQDPQPAATPRPPSASTKSVTKAAKLPPRLAHRAVAPNDLHHSHTLEDVMAMRLGNRVGEAVSTQSAREHTVIGSTENGLFEASPRVTSEQRPATVRQRATATSPRHEQHEGADTVDTLGMQYEVADVLRQSTAFHHISRINRAQQQHEAGHLLDLRPTTGCGLNPSGSHYAPSLSQEKRTWRQRQIAEVRRHEDRNCRESAVTKMTIDVDVKGMVEKEFARVIHRPPRQQLDTTKEIFGEALTTTGHGIEAVTGWGNLGAYHEQSELELTLEKEYPHVLDAMDTEHKANLVAAQSRRRASNAALDVAASPTNKKRLSASSPLGGSPERQRNGSTGSNRRATTASSARSPSTVSSSDFLAAVLEDLHFQKTTAATIPQPPRKLPNELKQFKRMELLEMIQRVQ